MAIRLLPYPVELGGALRTDRLLLPATVPFYDAHHRRLGGGSPWFRPDLSIGRVLGENTVDVILVGATWHNRFVPSRRLLPREGESVILAPESASQDDPPR
ncbi:MAG: hypothetical protein ACT4PV_00450 [Planctomycetaceae bacterium]